MGEWFISMIFFIWIEKNIKIKLIGLFFSTSIFVYSCILTILPRVEQYSQNAAIEFFKSCAKKDCYVTTYGYKSYAHYFYAEIKEPSFEEAKNSDWLIQQATDKDVYVVCKINKKDEFENFFSNFEFVESKNGFVLFLKRK